jgi:hypothetical protein
MSDGGGGGGLLGPVAPATPTAAPTIPGAAYAPTKQGPVYQPNYQQYQPQLRVPQQQIQIPSYQSGLQAAMMHMMQQYSRPMMRAPIQQGLTPSSPLAYRSPMQTENLNRVAPSVELQQRLAAEEAARVQAEQDAYSAAHPFVSSETANGY